MDEPTMDEPTICGGRGTTAYFDEMAWPRADNTTGAVEYALRHGEALRHGDRPSRGDVAVAASIIEAYRELVWCPRAKREAIIRRLREVARKFPADEDGRPIAADPPAFRLAAKPKPGTILDAIQAIRDAGGDAWDKIADPEAYLGRRGDDQSS